MRIIFDTLRELIIFSAIHFFEEDYEIRVHPTFPTACWRWDEKEKKHKILVGLGNGLKRKFEFYPEYMKSFGFHEFSHSLYTERDNKKIKETLSKKEIPFQLYNLFEDARIEHLWRVNYKRSFNWKDYEDTTKILDEVFWDIFYPAKFKIGHVYRWYCDGEHQYLFDLAVKIFFYFIQTEGEKPSVTIEFSEKGKHTFVKVNGKTIRTKDTVKKFDVEKLISEFINTVYDYYLKTINVKTFEELVEIIEEFLKEFGRPINEESIPQIVPEHHTITDEEFEEVWNEAMSVTINPDNPENNGGNEIKGLGERGDTEYGEPEGDRIIPSDSYTPVDWNRVEREVQKLLKAFRGYKRKIDTETPSRKLNPKKLSLDREDVYRKEEELSFRMLPFTILVDCSGSMSTMTPEQHMLVAIFSELTRKTKTEAYAIFTKDRKAQLFKLPMKKEHIERIPYDGENENILGGLKKFEHYILRTKYLFVISDMQITDYWTLTQEKIQNFKRKGIQVIGIYKGAYWEETKKNAPQFFERYIVCKDTNPIDLLIPILKAFRGR